MTVEIGDVDLQLKERSDFRIVVEGASDTGKSNTIARILEQLRDESMPMLLVERLSILSSIKSVDDEIIVVGGEDQEGIDMVVPIDDLDIVAEMILEEGRKVVLESKTYEEYDKDNMDYVAVGRVIDEIDKLALEKMRSGNRVKSLIAIDEAHYFAPENGAKHVPDKDQKIKNTRSKIIGLSIDGGNKGISTILSYQRRSFIAKACLTQLSDYIIHRLHANDRDKASDDIGVDEQEIANLSTGEAIVYGQVTSHKPQKVTVERRKSPDPREESFEIPEPNSDISELIEGYEERLEDKKEEREDEKTEKEKLEERIEELEHEKEKLRKETEIIEPLKNALERGSVNGDIEEVAQDMDELRSMREELEGKVNSLESKVKQKNREIDKLRDEVDEKDEKLRKLESRGIQIKQEDIDELFQNAQDILSLLSDYRGDDNDTEDVESDFSDAYDMLQNDYIDNKIQEASDESGHRREMFDKVLLVLIEESRRMRPNEISDILDVSDSSVRNVLRKLNDYHIVGKYKDKENTRASVWDIDEDNIESIISKQKKMERINETVES